jgi:cell division protein FtsW (lipid II flippase)
MALPFVLVFREPDLGSALILIPITLTMLYVAGVPTRYINGLIGVAGVLIVGMSASTISLILEQGTIFEVNHDTGKADAPTVISLFAGCGGSSLGYSMAGYRELLASRFWPSRGR